MGSRKPLVIKTKAKAKRPAVIDLTRDDSKPQSLAAKARHTAQRSGAGIR